MFSFWEKFWIQSPALLYGLSIFFGCWAFFHGHSVLFLFFLILLIFIVISYSMAHPFKTLTPYAIRILLSCLLSLMTFIYLSVTIHAPHLLTKGTEGIALFQIQSIQKSQIFFGESWLYKGSIKTFVSQEGKEIAKNIPCSVMLKVNKNRPVANQNYWVKGLLKKKTRGNYFLIPTKQYPWQAVPNSHSFAELRFTMKNRVEKRIHQSIADQTAAHFLSALATGQLNEPSLSTDFSRFGLQHILAISGFHFSIVAALLALIFGCLIEKKLSILIVLSLLSLYFTFLGCSPSVMRAWLTASIFLAGYLWKRQSGALNSLGIALGACLLIDPFTFTHLGFQFSFLTTAAILLFYPTVEQLLCCFFPKRPLSKLITMNSLNQHAYLFLTFLRQSLALNIAVHLVAIPVVLYYFQKFPLMSLFYNCFFPFLVSLSMILLMVGLLIGMFIPPIAELLHALNSSYTHMILSLTSNIPISLDYTLRSYPYSSSVLILYLFFLFSGGLLLKFFFDARGEQKQDFAFI